jgi:cytidylate kinase
VPISGHMGATEEVASRFPAPHIDTAAQSDSSSLPSRDMIVAIDGPAGSGKSTVASTLATRLGFHYLDTGAMYRALTWIARRDGADLGDGPALAALAQAHPVTFGLDGHVEMDGEDVTVAIRHAEIDRLVPTVAGHPEVRTVMRERQRSLATAGDSVIEGRDIGTVVAPDADVKVFLLADVDERARRRTRDRPGEPAETLAADLRSRDERDAVNTQPAADAVLLDTTLLSVEDVVERIAELVDARR